MRRSVREPSAMVTAFYTVSSSLRRSLARGRFPTSDFILSYVPQSTVILISDIMARLPQLGMVIASRVIADEAHHQRRQSLARRPTPDQAYSTPLPLRLAA